MARRLLAAKAMAVSTHVGGDGDGWGSACALAHQFMPHGIDVRLLAATPMPQRFHFLLPDGLRTVGHADGVAALEAADVHVVVDASEASRLGEFAPYFEPERTLVIDHHPVAARPIAAHLQLVDPSAAATAELVYDILRQTDEEIEPGAARALYVGLVTDTGSFRYSNSSPRSHRVAAALIESGAEPGDLYRPLFATLTPADLGTLRVALERMEHDPDLGLAWTTLDAAVARRFGVLDEYEDVIEPLRNLGGNEIAVLLREPEPGVVKISLRSSGAADVADLARTFGGGGHQKAAGATVEGDLDAVTERVVEKCRSLLREVKSPRP